VDAPHGARASSVSAWIRPCAPLQTEHSGSATTLLTYSLNIRRTPFSCVCLL